MRMPAIELRGLLAGYINGVTVAPLLGADGDCINRLVRVCVVGRELDQLSAQLRLYLQNNPAEWHQSANLLIYSAIFAECIRRQ